MVERANRGEIAWAPLNCGFFTNNTYIMVSDPSTKRSVSIDSRCCAFPQQSDIFILFAVMEVGIMFFAQSYAEHQSNACP
jgi:hypothetical protein